MLENEDRNCCCNKESKVDIPMYSYEFTNIEEEESCLEKTETREEMIQKIRSLGFAIVELAQYLDTHNDDKKALCLHKEYAIKLHDLKDKYQKVYGPLTIDFPCNKWRWIEEPWPSFGLEVCCLSTKKYILHGKRACITTNSLFLDTILYQDFL